MNFADGLLGIGWISFGWLIFVLALAWAIKSAPWYKVQGDWGALNVWLLVVVLLAASWSLGASIGDGFSFHFLFMAVVTLMFGPQFAFLAMSVALLIVSVLGKAGLTVYGLNAMVMGWVPIMIAWWIYKLSYRYLAKNFFVYVLLNGFFAAGVGVLVALMLATGIMLSSGAYTFADLKYNFLPFVPLIALPEGFLNGFIIAGLIMMRPQWIATFHDDLYFK